MTTPPDPARAAGVAAWTCPSCGATVSTAFCPACGERRLDPRELTLPALLSQLWRALSSIDGRLLRSLRTLVASPGRLTVAHLEGRRLAFLGPFQLFLMTNVLFFATQSLTHTNIVSSPLESHLHQQDWSGFARSLVADRLAASNRTLEAYEPLFDHAIGSNAKSLVILMVLPFAALVALVFAGRHRPAATHIVFATHLYSFLLMLFCVAMAIASVEAGLGGGGLASSRVDNILSTVNLVVCGLYLYIAAGLVYGARGASRMAAVLVLTIAVGAILLGYRFALFLITLYTT